MNGGGGTGGGRGGRDAARGGQDQGRVGRGQGRGGPDRGARDRQASALDRDELVYQRKRARAARRREQLDRSGYDPAPDPDGWTVEEEGTDGLRRVTPPTQLSESLGALLRRRGWTERLRSSTAWSRWDEIVGADLASRCEPVRVAGGVLVVRAESQVWATQLRYLLPTLRANVERVIGAGTVRSVRVVVGPLEGRVVPEEGAAGNRTGSSDDHHG